MSLNTQAGIELTHHKRCLSPLWWLSAPAPRRLNL